MVTTSDLVDFSGFRNCARKNRSAGKISRCQNVFFALWALLPKGHDPDHSCCASFVGANGPHQTPKEPSKYVQPLRKKSRFENIFSCPLATKPEVGVAK